MTERERREPERPQMFRPNVSAEGKAEAQSIWIRFAIAGLQSFTKDIDPLDDDDSVDPEEITAAAAAYADAMLVEWDDRFNAHPLLNPLPETEPEDDKDDDERSDHRRRGGGRRD